MQGPDQAVREAKGREGAAGRGQGCSRMGALEQACQAGQGKGCQGAIIVWPPLLHQAHQQGQALPQRGNP